MEPRILEEIRTHYKQDIIDFDWEPVRNRPKRYGVLYPIIGYIVSLLAIVFMRLGVFMWLFLIGGLILFFGGIFCANGMIGEYSKIKKGSENQKNSSEIELPSGF
jgi:hypothetical protein